MTNALANAMKAFVLNGCDRAKMNVVWWAKENKCGVEDVRAAWETAMTAHSTRPQNTYETPEGK